MHLRINTRKRYYHMCVWHIDRKRMVALQEGVEVRALMMMMMLMIVTQSKDAKCIIL